MKSILLTGIMGSLVVVCACATSPGDTPVCPICDNITELLVGSKCVPIDQIAPCGPDGNAHGAQCHCFSGQQPTPIGSQEYCLQANCEHSQIDIEAVACDEIDQPPEHITPVLDFANFEDAHLDLNTVTEIDLPQAVQSFAHFAGLETAEYAIFFDTANVLDAVLDADTNSVPSHIMNANPDCPTSLPEVWHVEVEKNSANPRPQILRFKASSIDKIKLVIFQIQRMNTEVETKSDRHL